MPKLKLKDEHTDIVWTRVDAVVNLILENDRYMQSKRNSELTKSVMEKFKLAERTAQRYISEAKKEIRKLSQADKKNAFAKAMHDREYLLQKAKFGLKDEQNNFIIKPDLALALDVVKDRDKLHGLYIDKINVNGEIRTKPDLSGLTIEELKAIAELKRK